MRLTRRAPLLATLLGVATFLASCVSLTPAGEQVRITSNPDVVRGCAFLGEMKATTQLGRAFGGEGTEDSERKLRNEVAAKGGNVVMIRRQDANIWGSARSVGEAYKCPEGVLAGNQTVGLATEKPTIASRAVKEKVLGLMSDGLGEEVIVAYVRSVQVSPSITAEEITDWKRAGISDAVIRAAIRNP